MLRKNVQDEHGAVDDFELGALGNGSTLARTQPLIKDEQISADLQTPHDDFVELATSQHVMRIALTALLDDTVDGHHAAGRGQFGQFLQRFFGNGLAPGGNANQDGALPLIPNGIRLLRPFKFIFQGLDEAEKIHFQLVDREAVLHIPLLAVSAAGNSLVSSGSMIARRRFPSPAGVAPEKIFTPSPSGPRWAIARVIALSSDSLALPMVPQIPHELEKLIARCLRKDPARRAQHMADLKLALEELKEESESGFSGSGIAPPPARARRRWLIPAIAGVVLLAASGNWIWVTLSRASRV